MKILITTEGTVKSLWNGSVDWRSLGRVTISRASHVEFCNKKQMWYVKAGRPHHWLRRVLQRISGYRLGEILYWANTREEALDWEQEYFGSGAFG